MRDVGHQIPQAERIYTVKPRENAGYLSESCGDGFLKPDCHLEADQGGD